MTRSILNGKRILAVDDEPDVLEVLEEEILEACPDCQFDQATSYEAAVEMLNNHSYDLVILDIMGVRGFELLNLAAAHHFKVVILTAHALSPEVLERSFELMARSYLPKEKLGEVVPFLEDILKYDFFPGWRHLILKPNLFSDSWPHHPENWSWPLKIYALGQFKLVKDGEPIRFLRKVQRKPLLLLKALIALGSEEVREEEMTELLWAEADGDAAHSAFTTTLSRLRRLLGFGKTIRVEGGKATLDPFVCWVDAWVFEQILEHIETSWKDIRSGEYPPEFVEMMENAIGLYKGHFLPTDEEHPWTVSYRERLRGKFIRLITMMGKYLRESGQWEKAVECYLKAIEVCDLTEEFYRNLMICYQKLGHWAEAIKIYNRCGKILSANLGTMPSLETEAIYKKLTERIRVKN
jgi:two-component SAPR family response regulator